jgi:hypothetical protein
MAQLDQTMLNAIVAAVMEQIKTQGAAPKGAAPQAKSSFGQFDPSKKDQWLRNSFSRRGFKNVTLGVRDAEGKIDNTNANVRPYRVWIELGRRVRRGEKGVRGLFHQDQTDLINPPKAELTPQRKAMFRKAKAKLTPVS